MRMSMHGIPRFLVLVWATLAMPAFSAEESADVVIYGATPGGITAAIQLRKLNKSVILLEPTGHLGGLTAGGLGATDIGNKKAIGGLSREFYHRIWQHYQDEKSWTRETARDYQSKRQVPGEETMWTFEPHVATNVFTNWLAEHQVPIRLHQQLVEVQKSPDNAIVSITATAKGKQTTIRGKVFIDTSYEGDLLALAGCSFHVGREANKRYGETLNGIQVARSTKHQFIVNVDPYVKKGDPTSGLLAGVSADGPGVDGDGDARVQAYNFRLCTTDVAENRIPWPNPADYDSARYELLFRNFEAGDHRIPWNPIMMPNRKTDCNNNFAISTDHIGANYQYANANWSDRQRIIDDHLNYHQGLLWSLANSPRVPEKIRKHFQTWGLCKDEFLATNGWPHQMYVREARRLIGEVVMTEHHCRGTKVADDSIGMGAYNMDSHNCQRYVTKEGFARNEGDIQVGVPHPYPISYRAIVPQKRQVTNLLVPVCLSASHIAYGSIRMEPVFMVLGQSSAFAAAIALDDNVAVQEVPYRKLNDRLLTAKQELVWRGPKKSARVPESIDVKSLKGVVVDDKDASRTGTWSESSSIGPFVGEGYLHDGNEQKGKLSAQFAYQANHAGLINIRLAYTANQNRATNTPIAITVGQKQTKLTINQRKPPKGSNVWYDLGRFTVSAGDRVLVEISNTGTDGHVIIDAVQFELIAP